MNCSPDLIAAYLDGELDAAQHGAVEQHMAGCPACSEEYARLRGQKMKINAAAPYYNAPLDLRQSVRGALRSMDTDQAPPPVRDALWKWLAIAACLLLAVSVSWNFLRPQQARDDLAENAISDHIRSLLGTHLMDVTSSDRHTVKPWFAGKLDFSPDVKDLAAQGFPLAGGRVDYLRGRRVAALIYYRRRHVINLFIWPAGSSGAEASMSHNGYNVVHWTSGAMTYWAVSDVASAELQNFRSLFR